MNLEVKGWVVYNSNSHWAFPEKKPTPLLRTLDIKGVGQIEKLVDIQGAVTKELVDIQGVITKSCWTSRGQ